MMRPATPPHTNSDRLAVSATTKLYAHWYCCCSSVEEYSAYRYGLHIAFVWS